MTISQAYWAACDWTQKYVHPGLFCTLWLISGIFLAWSYYVLTISFGILCVATLPCIISMGIIKKQPFLYLCFCLSFFVGWTRIAMIFYRSSQLHQTFCKTSADLTGMVTDIIEQGNTKTAIINGTLWTNQKKKSVRVMLSHIPSVFYIPICSHIQIRDGTYKFHGFSDYGLYLCKEKIDATINYSSKNQLIILSEPSFSFNRMIHTMRTSLCTAISQSLPSHTNQFFALIFSGKKPVDKKSYIILQRHFKTWGIMHCLARSGLHLVYFNAHVIACISYYPLRRRLHLFILFACMNLYCILSWTSISFMRAFWTNMLTICGSLSDNELQNLHGLSVITFFLLLYNPLYLFFLDFQLSFLLTGGIALWNMHTRRVS